MAAGLPDPKQIEELLLGGELRYNRVQAVRRAGASRDFAGRIWRAFGYPSMPDEEVAYTEGDVAALDRLRTLVADGILDEDGVVRLVRAYGQTMTRLAEWQVSLLRSMLTQDPHDTPSAEAVDTVVDIAEKHIGEFEPLVVHAWRRQLAAAGTRALAAAATRDNGDPAGRPMTTVGFADMVSFTQVSRELEEIELARVVEWFEETAADIIASRGGTGEDARRRGAVQRGDAGGRRGDSADGGGGHPGRDRGPGRAGRRRVRARPAADGRRVRDDRQPGGPATRWPGPAPS